jgi:hypothetical protein
LDHGTHLPLLLSTIAPLIGLLLIAAAAAPLLLNSATAAALHAGHGHAAGKSADEVLHFRAADQALPPVADGESLSRIGQSHAGEAPLTGCAAAAKTALHAADAATSRTVSEHAARPAAPCAQTTAGSAAA